MNENKFDGKAELYAKYRSSYPTALVDMLYEESGANSVADIGAGTGIFKKCLAVKPWKVTAVEPNADMAEQFKSEVGDKAELLAAPAENTGLPDNSVGLVTAAQSFHWFDEELFKAECKRILVPNGCLAIIWNTIKEQKENSLEDKLNALCLEYCGKCRAGKHRVENDGEDYLMNYLPNCTYYEFDNSEVRDKESFIGEVLSRSYTPCEGTGLYNDFKAALSELFDRYSVNGVVTIPRIACCYLYKNV